MAETIYERFCESVTKYPARTALLYKHQGRYRPMTYQELSDSVDRVAAAFVKLGIAKGDAVAIMSYNRPEWAMTDLAALKLGAVVVPLYYMPGHLLPAANVKYLLNDSRSTLIFVENAELLALIAEVRPETPHLKTVVVYDDVPVSGPGCCKFNDLVRDSMATPGPGQGVRGGDTATIVYTSGTTGDPKGVMLTHANILSNAQSAMKRCNFTPDDVVISYLPLGHMFERTCGYYSVLFDGGTIGYAQDLSTVVKDAEIVRPTIFLAVPRVLEKAYNIAVERIQGGSKLKRRLAMAALKNLNQRTNLRYKKMKVPFGLAVKCWFYNGLVAKKFQRLGGGRVRLIVSGGAPLNYQMAKIIHVLGFEIIEGWGLTETSPVCTCGVPFDNRIGSVGKPFDGVEVKIGENDEVLARGPNVMKGYFNRPEETAKIIDKEGWLHSGDQGRFDAYGNLVITGRIKELIITSTGKKIPPAPIEARITFCASVDQAVICGDNRPFLVGLVIPNREAVERYAAGLGLVAESYDRLLECSEVKEMLRSEVADATAELPSFEKPRSVGIVRENFTVENGLLTATLKIKRDKVLARHAPLIGALYGDKTETAGNFILINL